METCVSYLGYLANIDDPHDLLLPLLYKCSSGIGLPTRRIRPKEVLATGHGKHWQAQANAGSIKIAATTRNLVHVLAAAAPSPRWFFKLGSFPTSRPQAPPSYLVSAGGQVPTFLLPPQLHHLVSAPATFSARHRRERAVLTKNALLRLASSFVGFLIISFHRQGHESNNSESAAPSPIEVPW